MKYCMMIVLLLLVQSSMPAYAPSIEGADRARLEESFRTKTAEEVFTAIYETNYWHGWESRSGQGSNVAKTVSIRTALAEIIQRYNIKTLTDAPCGDFNWMKALIDTLHLELYIGIDIVKSVIKECQQKYGSSRTLFMYADLITCPLPKVDMIFSRDCLAHMSYSDALNTLKNFKESGSIYLLTSHHIATQANSSIVTGEHYAINLTLPPFNLPAPLLVVLEREVEPASAHQGKALALWRLEDIVL